MEKYDLLCEHSWGVASGGFFEGECLGSVDTSIKQRAKQEKSNKQHMYIIREKETEKQLKNSELYGDS